MFVVADASISRTDSFSSNTGWSWVSDLSTRIDPHFHPRTVNVTLSISTDIAFGASDTRSAHHFQPAHFLGLQYDERKHCYVSAPTAHRNRWPTLHGARLCFGYVPETATAVAHVPCLLFSTVRWAHASLPRTQGYIGDFGENRNCNPGAYLCSSLQVGLIA